MLLLLFLVLYLWHLWRWSVRRDKSSDCRCWPRWQQRTERCWRGRKAGRSISATLTLLPSSQGLQGAKKKKTVNFRSKHPPDLITQSTFFFLLLKWKYFTPQNMCNATVLTLVLSLTVTTTAIFIFLPLWHSNQMFKYNRLVGFLYTVTKCLNTTDW